jgi:RNA polymerase sigma-70 factor (ECF subfamily)
VKRKPEHAEPGEQALAPYPGQPAAEAREGQDSSPFERLLEEHWTRVCCVLFRLVGDRDEAEDLALEAFWRLYRRPPQDHNLAGWLYRVATNLGLNALRSRKRRKHYEEEAGLLDFIRNASFNPADEAESAEQRRAVRQVLAGMNARSAQLLVLRYSGFSYAEAAAVLGVAPTSIGALLARAESEFEKRYRDLEKRDLLENQASLAKQDLESR